MQIKSQASDLMVCKIQKIKCCTGCLNTVNYIVFGKGLYCSSCLSKIDDISQQNFINITQLTQVLVDLTNQYQQRTKGQTSNLNLMKGQMQSIKNDVKRSRQGLKHDLKTVKQKSFTRLDQLYTQCLKQHQNQPLQAFYQPDMTATMIINQFQSLLQNLNNLQITKRENKIQYNLVQSKKNPYQINKKIKKQYSQLNNCIQVAMTEAQTVIQNFTKDIALPLK